MNVSSLWTLDLVQRICGNSGLKKMMRKDYNIRCVHLGHDRFKGEVQTLAPPASDLEQLDGVEGVGGGTSVVATRLGATLAVCINGRL